MLGCGLHVLVSQRVLTLLSLHQATPGKPPHLIFVIFDSVACVLLYKMSRYVYCYFNEYINFKVESFIIIR